ncbi:MAG: hypothetical protein IJ575_07455 [Selenomonadaceae bacterium]|nr:hypothetical protein [Selenomonadaceae bacterium]
MANETGNFSVSNSNLTQIGNSKNTSRSASSVGNNATTSYRDMLSSMMQDQNRQSTNQNRTRNLSLGDIN